MPRLRHGSVPVSVPSTLQLGVGPRCDVSEGRRWIVVVRPEVGGDVAALVTDEADTLVFEEGALDAGVAKRPAAAQIAARPDDSVGGHVVRAVAHRPADLPRPARPAEQAGDGAVG